MTLEKLQKEMIIAMKNKDKERKEVLSAMIDSVKKASITSKGRVEITEKLVDETLIKYQKLIQEMVDTCPPTRPEKCEEYKKQLVVVKEFAPQLITDESEIANLITTLIPKDIEMAKRNKGNIMKILMPTLKGKVDGKILQKVLDERLV